jgi:hypothetical protein
MTEVTELKPCAAHGCRNRVAGSRFCPRCEEELTSIPWEPLREFFLWLRKMVCR